MLRFDREEALAAVASEYQRLGRPLDGVALSPSEAVDQVVAHLERTGQGSGPAGDEGLAGDAEGGDGGELVICYTVNFTTDDGWTLNAYEGNILQASVPLPEPESSWGFWQIVIQDGEAYVWSGGDEEGGTLNCAETIASAAATMAPGVAANSTNLPGMGGTSVTV